MPVRTRSMTRRNKKINNLPNDFMIDLFRQISAMNRAQMALVSRKYKNLVNRTNRMITNEFVGRPHGNKVRRWITRSGPYTITRLLVHLNAMRYKTFGMNELFGSHRLYTTENEWNEVIRPQFRNYMRDKDENDFQFEPNTMYFDTRIISDLGIMNRVYNFGTKNDYINEMRNVPNQYRRYFDFLALFYDNGHILVFLNNRFVVHTPTLTVLITYNDIFGINFPNARTFYDLLEIIVELYNRKIIGRAGKLEITGAKLSSAYNKLNNPGNPGNNNPGNNRNRNRNNINNNPGNNRNRNRNSNIN